MGSSNGRKGRAYHLRKGEKKLGGFAKLCFLPRRNEIKAFLGGLDNEAESCLPYGALDSQKSAGAQTPSFSAQAFPLVPCWYILYTHLVSSISPPAPKWRTRKCACLWSLPSCGHRGVRGHMECASILDCIFLGISGQTRLVSVRILKCQIATQHQGLAMTALWFLLMRQNATTKKSYSAVRKKWQRSAFLFCQHTDDWAWEVIHKRKEPQYGGHPCLEF